MPGTPQALSTLLGDVAVVPLGPGLWAAATVAVDAASGASLPNGSAFEAFAVNEESATKWSRVKRAAIIDPATGARTLLGPDWTTLSGTTKPTGTILEDWLAKTEEVTLPLTSGATAFTPTFAFDDIDIRNAGSAPAVVTITDYGTFTVFGQSNNSPELGGSYFGACSVTGTPGTEITVQFSRRGRA